MVEPRGNFVAGGTAFVFWIAIIAESWPARLEQYIQSINSPKKVLDGRIGTNIVVQNTQKLLGKREAKVGYLEVSFRK